MPFLCCGSQAKVDADPAEVYFPPKQESDGRQQQKQCQDQIKQQVTLTESKESEKPKGTKEQIQQEGEPELVKQAPAPENGQPRQGPGQEQGPELSDLKKPEQAEDQKRSQGDTICERQESAGHIEAEVGLLRETGQIEDAKAGSKTKDTVEEETAASGQSEVEAGKGQTRIDMTDSKGDSDLPSEHAEGRKEKTTKKDAQAEYANTAIDKQESDGSSTPATYPSEEEALARRELSAMEVNVHVAVTCVIMEGIEEHVCELELPPVDSNMFVAVTTPSIVSESVTSVVENTKNKEENILYGNEAKQLPENKTEQMGGPKGDSSGAEQSGRVGPSEEWTESRAGEAKDSPCAKGPVSEAEFEAEEEVEESAARGLEERAPSKSPGAGSGEHPSGKHPVAPGDGDETEPVEERRRRRDRRQRRPLRSASGDDTSDEDEIVPLRRKKEQVYKLECMK
ncbi:neurofilament medium polypeptide-like [Penaeus indicus]|uniref:neurofilament medium polypeptide-like n=1 Tax=Penaeus indicus TaxID=29960 RepID=UPI00300CB3C1